MNLRIAAQLILPGLATALGAIPIFFTKNISKKTINILLGFAAGVMLAATFFSLLVPSIEMGSGGVKGILITSLGILVGCIVLDLIDRYLPHEHLITHDLEGKNTERLKKYGCLLQLLQSITFQKDWQPVSLLFPMILEMDYL